MRTTIHWCQDVEGALLNWSLEQWFDIGRTNKMSAREAKRQFIQYIREGKNVIPIGECDNFDYKEGCLGHPQPETEVKEENAV